MGGALKFRNFSSENLQIERYCREAVESIRSTRAQWDGSDSSEEMAIPYCNRLIKWNRDERLVILAVLHRIRGPLCGVGCRNPRYSRRCDSTSY